MYSCHPVGSVAGEEPPPRRPRVDFGDMAFLVFYYDPYVLQSLYPHFNMIILYSLCVMINHDLAPALAIPMLTSFFMLLIKTINILKQKYICKLLHLPKYL